MLIPVRDSSPFLLLQCVTDPGLGLLVADPFPFYPEYNVKLEQAEKKIWKKSWTQLVHRTSNMDTLVALSAGIAYLFSLLNLLFPSF